MSLITRIAYTGLNATQLAMTGSSQNVANVNTPGYSRLSTVMSSLSGQAGLTAGGGVEVTSIRRMASDFNNQQLWRAHSEQRQFEAAQQYLGSIESLMAGDGTSISRGLDQLFAALSEASVSPESVALRQQVISEAGNLARRFNSLAGGLDAQLRSLHEQRAALVGETNGLLANLAALNRQIVEVEAVAGDSKALRDHRDMLVTSLSGVLAVRVSETADGALTVSLANGQPLVVGRTAAELTLQTQPDGQQQLGLAFAKSQFALPLDQLGGNFAGLHAVEYRTLRPQLAALDEMAGELAVRSNAILQAGYDLNGNPGQPLFVHNPGSTGGLLQINQLGAADLAFSDQPGEPGNNKVLLQWLDLRSTAISVGGNTLSLNDAYATLLGRVASDSRQNQADLESSVRVLQQAQAQRDRESAVNRDEEAVNLLNYQQAYQANMKVITTAGLLFDSLLAAF